MLLLSHDVVGSPPLDSRENKEIVGQATNIITAKLLKGNVDSQNNLVFSPIGYASILAILGEGAQDDTNNDIKTVLKHPNDHGLVRSAYRSVLSHLQGTDSHAAPQFRSWLYIYKNNTIEDSYREFLVNDFYVTVRNVEPYNEQISDEVTTYSIVKTTEEAQSSTQAPDQVKNYEKPTNSKDVVEFDSFKMESGPVDETRIDKQDDASKFDEIIEDRQYVEVPLIKGQMEKTASDYGKGNEEAEKSEEEVKNVEKAKVNQGANGAKKVLLPFKHYEEMEIMQAAETRFGKVVSFHRSNIVYYKSIFLFSNFFVELSLF